MRPIVSRSFLFIYLKKSFCLGKEGAKVCEKKELKSGNGDRSYIYKLTCRNCKHTHQHTNIWIRSRTGSTRPREDNWVATWLRSSDSD